MYKQAFHRHCHSGPSFGHGRFGGQAKSREWKEVFQNHFSRPPANVKEEDGYFELHLIAPGFEKSDFTIAIIDNKISISVSKEEKIRDNWKRQEFIPSDFVREFELNEKIDKSNIEATYNKGILIVKLPKMEGFETSRETIEIQ